MASAKLITLANHMFTTRKFHSTANRMSSNWRDLMKKELESGNSGKHEQTYQKVCIYRVPSNIRRVEPKAYRPNNISIGPCHHGAPHLRNMEALKKRFFRRLFIKDADGDKLDEAFKFLEEQESNVRSCYNEDIKLSSDEFLQMMLVDASFIIRLLRDLSESKFQKVPPCLSPWMLPIIRREMIMLENQLPMFVLSKLFELTAPSGPNSSLKTLALRFFYHLLRVDSDSFVKRIEPDELGGLHFVDLLRSSMRASIRPKLEGENSRKCQHHMIRSATELIEAGVKIKAYDSSKQLLDISFGKKWLFLIRQLTIPPLYIDDHKGTVFRNIVAFEKCHKDCHPDVTNYLFFFNGLINSAGDVSLLHYKGVLYHSLGSDRIVSELINNITKEIVQDENDSYLYKVVYEVNSYFGKFYARKRASLVHHYLKSWVVGVSTIGALLALYFTFIQTVCSFADSLNAFANQSFRSVFLDIFCIPVFGIPTAAATKLKRMYTRQLELWNRHLMGEKVDICMWFYNDPWDQTLVLR